jgi:hypothetical protein
MPFGGEPIGPPASLRDRQICYEVRYMKLRTEPWRELLEDRLKLVQQEADVSAWIVDKKPLADLLNLAQADTTSNVLQAPRVTTFENDHATFSSEHKQFYVSGLEKLEPERAHGFRPIMKAIDYGWRADMVGSILSNGTNVSVDARELNLVAVHALTRKEWFGDQEIVGTYQVPSTVEHRCRVACDIPEDSSLVISLGLQINKTPIFTGVTEVAGKFLESVGLPRNEPKAVTCERLVVITPRPILLEAEQGRPETASIKGGFDDNKR